MPRSVPGRNLPLDLTAIVSLLMWKKLEFARWGRGMSYHELELALGSLTDLNIISDLVGF